MVRFWETSVIVALITEERTSKLLTELLRQDRQMHVWWAAEVECVSAFSRLEREGKSDARVLIDRLREYLAQWVEVDPVSMVRETAKRFLRVYPLRAADALHLAAAWVLSESNPSSVEFVSLDQHLRDAASREGFTVLPVM